MFITSEATAASWPSEKRFSSSESRALGCLLELNYIMGTQSRTIETDLAESEVSFQTSQGFELRAALLKVSRFHAVFEVYGPADLLQTSEVLQAFKLQVQGRLLYSGRAVVHHVLHLGASVVCEVTLDEACLDLTLLCPLNDVLKLRLGFEKFIVDWGRVSKVQPDFKVVMADMQSLFLDLRLWMEQMELAVRSQPSGNRLQLEREVLFELAKPVLPMVQPVLEKFESIANQIDPDRQPIHRAYMKRQIHPVVLCSPFLFRTFQKPLGYAGDYEMVNMMVREPFEGGSMFAKLVNRVFLNTPPVVAHQSRITYLTRHLVAETARAAAHGRVLRVYNLGCGPAKEIQNFLAGQDLCDRVQFTLLDFNEETIAHTTRVLGDLKRQHGRITPIQMIKKSVHHILKDTGRAGHAPKYDFIYCAGLFDYLSDQVCHRLLNHLYDLLQPGGLLLSTNVGATNPSRNWMEYVLDWHLIYRDAAQFAALAPDAAPRDSFTVQGIGVGHNLGLEVRKPANAS
jgi:extracellular factor (EF) 3-hydroxypalmitic acid methyl ester biosynthesis protein